jgi:hypothetical protein
LKVTTRRIPWCHSIVCRMTSEQDMSETLIYQVSNKDPSVLNTKLDQIKCIECSDERYGYGEPFYWTIPQGDQIWQSGSPTTISEGGKWGESQFSCNGGGHGIELMSTTRGIPWCHSIVCRMICGQDMSETLIYQVPSKDPSVLNTKLNWIKCIECSDGR